MLHRKETLLRWTEIAHKKKVIREKEINQAIRELLPGFRYIPKKKPTDQHKIIDQESTIEDPIFENDTNKGLLLDILNWVSPESKILPESKTKLDYIKEKKQEAQLNINTVMQELSKEIGDEFKLNIIKEESEYKIILY